MTTTVNPDSDSNRTIYLHASEDLASIARNLTASRLIDILDQAENGNTADLWALYRDVLCDSHIQTEFGKRKGAVLGDVRNLVPYDRKDPQSVATKDRCFSLIETDAFYDGMSWLLNATLYPVAVVEKVFAPVPSGYDLAALRSVPFQMLDLSDGTVRIFDVLDGRIQSTRTPAGPDRYIIHRSHNMPMPDRWGGPMRSILFWWLLRTMSRQWWASLLERFGTPFLTGEYKNESGRQSLERAFSMASRLGGIVVSAGTKIQLERAASSDSEAGHSSFFATCNDEISRLIVGQTLSSTTSPTGEIGGGTAGLQGEVRDDIRKSDASMLSMTVRSQLLAQHCRINALSGHPPIMMFGSDSMAEIRAAIGMVADLSTAGLEPDDDGLATLSERVGFGLRRKPIQPGVMPLSADVARAIRDVSAPPPHDPISRALARYS